MMENAKKYGFWDIVKQGFSIYIKNIWIIIALDLVVVIPQGLSQYLTLTGNETLWALPLGVVNIVAGVFNLAALFSLFAAAYRGEKQGIGEAFTRGLKLWPRMLVTNILYGLATLAGMLLLIIPGVFIAMKYFFAVPATVEEDKTEGPMGRAGKLSKGNMGLIALLIFCVYLPLSVPVIFAFFAGAGNPAATIVLAYALGLISTIAQAIHYVAYAKTAEAAASAAPEGGAPAQKGIGVLGGCLIALGVTAVIIAGIAGAGYYAFKNVGMEKIMKGLVGDTMKLSEEIVCTYPDKWYGMPSQGIHTAYIVTNADLSGKTEETGVTGVFFRAVPFPEEFSRGMMAIDAAGYIEQMEKEIDTTSASGAKSWVVPEGLRSEEVRLGTQKWRRITLGSRPEEGDKTGKPKEWRILYTRSGDKFVYFYYAGPDEKTDRQAYADDEKTLYDMVAGIKKSEGK